MPTHYPNTYKAIYSINEQLWNYELWNYVTLSTNLSMTYLFNKTFLRPLHMSITLDMIITGYPKVL